MHREQELCSHKHVAITSTNPFATSHATTHELVSSSPMSKIQSRYRYRFFPGAQVLRFNINHFTCADLCGQRMARTSKIQNIPHCLEMIAEVICKLNHLLWDLLRRIYIIGPAALSMQNQPSALEQPIRLDRPPNEIRSKTQTLYADSKNQLTKHVKAILTKRTHKRSAASRSCTIG